MCVISTRSTLRQEEQPWFRNLIGTIEQVLAASVWGLLVFAQLSARSDTGVTYSWTTLAGYALSQSSDGTGPDARFNNPSGIASDAQGNAYVVDAGNYTIRRISAAGEVVTIAGLLGVRGFADDSNGKALFNSPSGITVDGQGNVYVADALTIPPAGCCNNYYVIRKIAPVGTNWVVTTIVDSAVDGVHIPSDHGNALMSDGGLAVDSAGNLYLAEGQAIRMIRPVSTNWIVSTVANTCGCTWFDTDSDFSGQREGVTNHFIPRFAGGRSIAVDTNSTLYVAGGPLSTLTPVGTNWGPSLLDVAHLVDLSSLASAWKQAQRPIDAWLASQLSPATTTVLADYTGVFGDPTDVPSLQAAVLHDLNALIQGLSIYDSQRFDGVILRPETETLLSKKPQGDDLAHLNRLLLEDAYPVQLARNPGWLNSSIGGLSGGSGVAVDSSERVYVASGKILQVLTPQGTNWLVRTLAGSSQNSGSVDGTATNALFNGLSGVAVDRDGNLMVADSGNNLVRKVTAAGAVRTIAGSAATDNSGVLDGVGHDARFSSPRAVVADDLGNVYVIDTFAIRMVTPAGLVSTIAGSVSSQGTNDGVGANARFLGPRAIAMDRSGNLFVTDSSTVRMVTSAAVVTTIAGSPTVANTVDGGGADARFIRPDGIAVDREGHVFVVDPGNGNQSIRKLTRSGAGWVVSTIVSNVPGLGSGELTGLAVAKDGTLFALDDESVIHQISSDGTNWVTTTVATLGGHPEHIAIDGVGNLFVGHVRDLLFLNFPVNIGHTVQRISPEGTNWVISTIGGPIDPRLDIEGGNADGTGADARFQSPLYVAADSGGTVYVSDPDNLNIRKGVFTAYATTQSVAYTPPPMTSQLTVMLQPPEANGQWRFPWEVGWRASGSTASNLVAGNYSVEFRNVPGWLALPDSITAVLTTNSTVSITNQYLPTLSVVDTNAGGSTLTVSLGINPPPEAGWRFLGETTPFLPSGVTTNLLPGTYLVEFAPSNGRVTPPSQAVQVSAGLPSSLVVNYLLAGAQPSGVSFPFPVPENQLNEENSYPFRFNGQLLSDNGYGSGVAVDTNVVLTAAHVVFNEQTLGYVSQAYWFFRRDAGVSEPLPQAARSFYLLSGYAAQRSNDVANALSLDQSTPPSRNLDVGVLFFQQPVAGGGHGGYLPANTAPNPWLGGNALKMLVGYPVDGSQFGDATIVPGKMYQTTPQPLPLTLATDPVPGQQQVYVAPWFMSYPGNSGGPLYVQLNGSFYPAAVYLGTLFSGAQPYASVVRAIDSNVVNLIQLAATLGESGTNFTGGGVITIIPSQAVTIGNPGYLQLQLGPPAAVQAGAGWRLQGDAVFSGVTNYTRKVSSTNAVVIEFKQIPGWNVPSEQTVTVTPGKVSVYTASYTLAPPSTPIVPIVASFTPAQGKPGDLVQITGSNLLAAVAVKFNGTQATFIAQSDNSILATVPAGATSGPISVEALGGIDTSGALFTVVAPPTVTGFTPISAPAGTSVQITGTGLANTTEVKFNGVDAVFNVASDQLLNATVPTNATTGPISVQTPGGTATTSVVFGIVSVPILESISPVAGIIGSTVHLNGANLSSVTRVTFNGVQASFVVFSDQLIVATVPVGITTGLVTVEAPAGTAKSGINFVLAAAPTISSFSPTHGLPGTVVQLGGTGFTAASEVTFAGTEAQFAALSDGVITAILPVGAATGPITVQTPGGTASSSLSFAVVAPPTITSITPTNGPAGTIVQISGTNLLGATQVSFNGVAAVFNVASALSISATVPTNATTGSITVETPGGSATSTGSFEVIPPPVITSFTPAAGAPGVTVEIDGANLAETTNVQFSGVAALWTPVSDTVVRAIVPTNATTGAITVQTPGGTITSSNQFQVLVPPVLLPRLTARITDSSQLELAWTASAGGFTLQFTDDLNSLGSWKPVAGTLTQTGDTQTIAVAIEGTTRFYRLAQ
jgi:sugar lactone lactonase YvrE